MPCACNTTRHGIGWAVKQARLGQAVTRRGWKYPGQRVVYVAGEGAVKGYLKLVTASGRSWPMTFGQRDMLAKDWMLAV